MICGKASIPLKALVVLFALRGSRCLEEARLIGDILAGYDTDSVPYPSRDQPVQLTFDVALAQILDLDEKLQIMTTSVWVRQYWKDNSLRWNPKNYSGIGSVKLSATRIWKPDTTLYNSAEEASDTFQRLFVATVTSEGDVTWLAPRIFQTSCILDVTEFPWDHQLCTFQFGSWAYDGFRLDILNKTPIIDTSSYTPHGEWELLTTDVQKVVSYYECCPEPYPTLTYKMRLHRKALFYEVNIIFPSACISGTALLMFIIPPDSGEKLSLAITLFLSNTVFLMVVVDMLPVQSVVLPAMGRFCCQLITLMALGTAGTALVVHLHFQGTYIKRVPKWIHVIVLHWLAVLVVSCQYRCKPKHCPWRNSHHNKSTVQATLREKYLRSITKYAANGPANTVTEMQNGRMETPYTVLNGNVNDNLFAYGAWNNTNGSITQDQGDGRGSKTEQNYEVNAEEATDEVVEWPKVAMVVDRLFLIVYIVAYMSAFMALYFQKHTED